MNKNILDQQNFNIIDYCVNSNDNTSPFVRFYLTKLSNILQQTQIHDDEFLFIMSDIENIMKTILIGYPTNIIVDCLKTSFVKESGGATSETHIAEVLLHLRLINNDEYLDIVNSHKKLAIC